MAIGQEVVRATVKVTAGELEVGDVHCTDEVVIGVESVNGGRNTRIILAVWNYWDATVKSRVMIAEPDELFTIYQIVSDGRGMVVFHD